MNDNKVWIVYDDGKRSFKRAERFGELNSVVSAPYDNRFENSQTIVGYIRDVMSDYRDGDYLLMVGEPTLCGLAIAIAREKSEGGVIKILRWDKITMDYGAMALDFSDNFNL